MTTKLSRFFGVIAQSRTYLSLLYLLLSFPLGIFYFVLIVTGLSVGFGLVFTLIGIPILFVTLLLWRVFASFECLLSKIMLGIDVGSVPMEQKDGLWGKIKNYLTDSYTWKGLVYVLLKFPIGIFSFVVLTTLLSVSFGLIATSVLYHLGEIGILNGPFCIEVNNICFINSYLGAIVVGVVGMLLLFVFLHALNGLARVLGLLTKAMLERK